MMIAHQTKTKNKSFSQEFCWKIASLFLNSDYSNINILHEHIIRSYEDPKDTYALRKEMIQKATGDVYIAGTTLKDAFSTASSNKETSIIQELIQNSNINNIYIFASHKVAYMEKGLTIKKIHPTQLDNLVRTSFVTLDESSTNSIHSVFSIPEKDKTQEVLLPYLQETERLLEKLVTDHDPHGWAKIIPCNDLGFPNNITRIAGGFLTGAYYNWSCAVPIVPVDTLVPPRYSNLIMLIFKLLTFRLLKLLFGKFAIMLWSQAMRFRLKAEIIF